MRPGESIECLAGGWARFRSDRIDAMVRFMQSPTGRLVVSELAFVNMEGARPSYTVQKFPMSRVEAWANGSGCESLLLSMVVPGLDVRSAVAAAFPTHVPAAAPQQPPVGGIVTNSDRAGCAPLSTPDP